MTAAGKQLSLGQLDAMCPANVAPSGRNAKVLSYPGLRRPPGASPGVMHGAALRAERGLSLFLLSLLVKVPSGPKTAGM